MSGDPVMVEFDDRTNTYTVTMDAETGEWSAMYVPHTVMVDLGTSGLTQELTRDEMGGWWTDPDTAFNSGESVTADNGRVYRLTFVDGEWGSMYVPATMTIMGTNLTAVANENDGGYTIMDLAGQTLDENGMGSVMSPDGNFRVHKDADGNLIGVQFEAAVDAKNGTPAGGAATAVAVVADNAKTTPNEAGTMIKIDGIDHKVGDLFQDGSSMVEGDNLIAGVLKDVTAVVAQIKGLLAVNAQEADEVGDDQTNFGAQFRTKWHEIDRLLDKVFTTADRTDETDLNELAHLEALPGTVSGTATTTGNDARLSATAVTEMVETLDKIVAALTNADDFATEAAAGGLFASEFTGNAAKRATDSAKVFNAVDSTATAYIAMTANTRFGISKKQTSDNAEDGLGSAMITAFAYSPMKAAKFTDLPQAGAAEYNGRTMAISVDGKTVYNGDISLQVRFRGKRVSGLVENLVDGDGNAFTYGFGTVAAIILAEATIMGDGDFTKNAERDSQIVFVAEPGQPQATILEDGAGPDGTPGNDDDVAGSAFAGQFVGGGAAAVGTWAISASTNDAENLTASFGVEKGEEVPETVTTPVGGGESMTSIHDIADPTPAGISEVLANGMIELVSGTAATRVRVNGKNLFDSGGETTNGASFVAEAIKAIQDQLKRLDAFIALDALGDEAAADTGRTAVWTALATALDPIVGSGNGSQIFATSGDNSYDTSNANDAQADADAKELIAQVLDALSSAGKFRAATLAEGVLYGTSGLITGNNAAKNAIFARVKSTTKVEYGSTKYTRFGAWNRVATTSALTEASDTGLDPANGVFAYSPLAATKYAVNDPNYPGGGKATYEGTTIARGADAANTYYEGSITLDVTWTAIAAADGTPNTTVGSIAASINNLRNDKGALYMNDAAGGGTDYGVETIVLAGTSATSITRAADGTLSFTDSALSASRLRHTDLRIGDDTVSATINGMFVGKVIDGPLGIIGSWTLTNTNGDDLAGAYGADLMP